MRLLTTIGLCGALACVLAAPVFAGNTVSTGLAAGQMMMVTADGRVKVVDPWGDTKGIEDVWAKAGTKVPEQLFVANREGQLFVITQDAKMSDGTMLSSHF